MKNQEYDINIIEQYLRGELEETKRQEIEERIVSDSEFAAEVDLVKATLNTVKIGEDIKVNELFDSMVKEVKEEGIVSENIQETIEETPDTTLTKKQPDFFKWIATGIGVLLIISLIVHFTTNTSSVSSEDLYTSNYEAYRAPNITRSTTIDNEDLWISGVQHYQDGEYLKAIVSWNDLMTKNGGEGDYLTYFYTGMALMQYGKPEDAIPSLQKVLISDNDYRQQAEWYLAMSYLKTGEQGLAILQLQQIVINPEHYKLEEAEIVLKNLK